MNLEGPPGRPVRKSLSDSELFDLATQDAGSAFERLEEQLQLREQDARDYSAWESSMLSLGTPDALDAVASARQEFGDIVPPAQPVADASPIAPVAEPVLEQPTVAEPVSDVPVTDISLESFPPPAPTELPAWDVPPPSETWSPGPDLGDTAAVPVVSAGTGPEAVEEPGAASEPEPAVLQEAAAEPEPAAEAAPVAEPEHVAPQEPVFEFAPYVEPESVEPEVVEPVGTEPEAAEPESVEPESSAPVWDLDSTPPAEAEPAPEPVTEDAPEPPLDAPEPVFTAPEPAFDAPEPIYDAPEPSYEPEQQYQPEQSYDAEPPADEPEAGPEFDRYAPPTEPAFEQQSYEAPAEQPFGAAPEEPYLPPVEQPLEASFAPPPLVEPTPFAEPTPQVPITPPLVDSVPDFTGASDVVEPAVAPAEPVAAEPIPELIEPGTVFPPPVVDPATIDPNIIDAEIVDPEVVAPSAIDSEVIDAEIVEDEAPGTGFVFGAAATAGAAPASFDDLLSGASDGAEEPLLHADPLPTDAAAPFPEQIFIEPLPVAAGEAVPTETGSVSIIEPAYEEELEDDVDETDRIPVAAGAAVAGAAVPQPISPPSGPISTVRIPEDETVIMAKEPVAPRVFVVEKVALEPTPLDQRIGRAARLFWLWFAANSSIVSLGLGATVFAVGMSLRQSIVAILAGVALSFVPLGLTTLAGKRSGQPTMVISRATFGHIGNILPALIALIGRVFWGAVLLWLVGSSVAVVLGGAGATGSLGELPILLVSLGVAFLIALLVAIFGYAMIARIQLIVSILAAVLVVGFIALTASYINLSVALTVPDGSWLGVITGAVLVFSLIGLVWANSGADLARYQRPSSSGGASMLWGTFGATVPAFLLVAYGALLAASNPGIASGFLQSPLSALASMLPSWYPVPLIAAAALSLLSGVVITIYSGAFAFQSVGIRTSRPVAVVIVAVLLAVLAVVFAVAIPGGLTTVFRDAATTLAVPTAAWAGIFAAETMIRNRNFESNSLLSRGGVYPDWRWANVIGFVLITALGFGLTTATVSWLGWQGYIFSALGVPLDGPLAGTDAGVLVALLLGILVPIVSGIPAIRRQEESRLPERPAAP